MGIGTISGHMLRRSAVEGAWVWIALPLLIIYVLGISLQGLFAQDFAPPRPYTVVVAGDAGPAASEVSGVLRARPDLFDVSVTVDGRVAQQSVLERKADAAVIVPGAYPGEPVLVVAAPGTVVREAVAGAVEAALRRLNPGEEAGGRAAGAAESEAAVADPGATADGGSGAGAAGDGAGAALGASRTLPPWAKAGSFDYYAVGTTIMFLMYTVHASMIYCARDRASGAYARIRSFGISRTAYLAAGFLSSVAAGIVFVLAMAVLTRILYGVDWGDPLAWAAVAVAAAAGAAAVSFVVAAVVPPNPKSLDNAGSTLFTILAFLGGSTVPLSVLPDWFAKAFAWLPNRIALEGFFIAASGGGLPDVAGRALTLLLVAFALVATGWTISSVRAKREE